MDLEHLVLLLELLQLEAEALVGVQVDHLAELQVLVFEGDDHVLLLIELLFEGGAEHLHLDRGEGRTS